MLVSKIVSAALSLSAYHAETPCMYSPQLSRLTGANVYLKCEHLQKTGSFKLRGALNKMLSIDESNVIAASSGNHGKAVAYAAAMLGKKAKIYLPTGCSPTKINAIKALKADIIEVEGDFTAVEQKARQDSANGGGVYISPYNDHDVIAGQGSIGVEIATQLPQVDAVFASVGGGGMISGIGSYLKHEKPQVEIVGCWPENSAVLSASLKAGKIIKAPESPTLSDGTAGQVEEGAITFDICQKVIDRQVLTSEDEIKKAMRLLGETDQFMVEGAAAVALASFLKNPTPYKGKNVVIILCGRNVSMQSYLAAVAG